jgi:ribosomal protein L29
MSDIQKKDQKELKKEIDDMRASLREFRFAIAGSRTRNVREGRTLRKEIARRLAELNRRTRAN